MPSLLDSLEGELARLDRERSDLSVARARAAIRHELFGEAPKHPQIGRFVVLEKLGAGGMGVVFAAYDTELDRKVAIKLLRSTDENNAERLVREARVMARLSHPNIVPVYETGVVDGQVFLVMEFVDGKDLRKWLDGPARQPSEVLAVLRDAGRGLAAAHRMGIIHRDFKPENVLVGSDGRARVSDFGLARPFDDAALATHSSGAHPSNPGTLRSLTRTGALLGTPAYMAPELYDGAAATVESDVYAFCVTAFEAMVGKHPYQSRSLLAMIEQARAARVIWPAQGQAGLPRRIRRALIRGLSPDPSARFPSVDAILSQFEPTARSSRWWFAVAGAALLGAAIAAGTRSSDSEPPRCTGAAAAWASVWSPERRQALTRSWGLGTAEARAVERIVDDELELYGRRWQGAHTEACLATTVLGERSQALLDVEMLCLDRRARAVRQALLVVQDEPEHAAAALTRLADPEHCLDVDRLTAELPPPEDPEVAAQVETIEDDLTRMGLLHDLGRTEDARALKQRTLERARTVSYPPALARVLLTLRERRATTETDIAETYEALHIAERYGADALTLQAWLDLVIGLGNLGRYPEGERAIEHANAWLEKLGDPEHLRRDLHEALGVFWLARSDYSRAIEHFQLALELEESLGGVDPERMATAHGNLGTAYSLMDESERAAAAFEDAYAAALSLGEEPENLGWVMFNLGRATAHLELHEDSNRWYERAIEHIGATRGPTDFMLALSLNNMGQNYCDMGYCYEAIPPIWQALTMTENRLGPNYRQLTRLYRGLAEVYLETGDLEAAIEVGRKAVTVAENSMGAEHPDTARTYDRLAQVLLAAGRHDEARSLLERALAVMVRSQEPSHELGRVRWRLSMASWVDPSRRAQAMELARQAERDLADSNKQRIHLVAVRAWLDEHDPERQH